MFPFSIPSLSRLRRAPYRDAMADAPTRTPTLTSFPAPPTPAQAFRFLDLPLELREQVYELYFRPADRLQKSSLLEGQGFYGGVYAFEFGLYRTCKQIAREAKKVWRRSVMTVKVATPWPSAGECFCQTSTAVH